MTDEIEIAHWVREIAVELGEHEPSDVDPNYRPATVIMLHAGKYQVELAGWGQNLAPSAFQLTDDGKWATHMKVDIFWDGKGGMQHQHSEIGVIHRVDTAQEAMDAFNSSGPHTFTVPAGYARVVIFPWIDNRNNHGGARLVITRAD